MRIAASVVVLIALRSAAIAESPTVDLQIKDAHVIDVLRLLGDVAHVNIVPVDIGDPLIDIQVKRAPWGKVLDQVAQMTKLTYHRTGNLILIGAPAVIDPRRKAPATAYTGPIVSLDVVDADAADAARLLAAATAGIRGIAPRAPRRATVNLRKLPADQVLEVLAFVAGGTVEAAATPVKPAGCALPKASVRDAKLVGVAAHGEKRWALVRDPAGTAWIVQRADCIGIERAAVKDIGDGYAVVTAGSSEVELALHTALRI